MDINYYMKLQNANGTKSKREKELAKTNYHMSKHFNDTYDTENVLLNGKPFELMIIKDTDGNTYKKKIKSKHDDKFNLGDYVEWNGQMWLVTLLDSDEKTWNRGYMYLCSILLRWQNDKGDIVERWGYSEDFTKYSSGISRGYNITMGDYQYGLTLPVDDETKFVKRDKRFPIDIEGVEPPDVYTLTNRKILLSDDRNFGRGGVMTWTLSFGEFNGITDKKIKLNNDTEVWICDYIPPSPTLPQLQEEPLPSSTPHITFKGKQDIKIGGNFKTVTGFFTDKNDNELSDIGHWEVIAIDELSPYIQYTIDGNILKIKVLYNEFVMSGKIRIKFSNDTESTYLDFDVVSGF